MVVVSASALKDHICYAAALKIRAEIALEMLAEDTVY